MDRGDTEYALGKSAAAHTWYERAIDLCEDDFDPMVVTLSLQGMARCALRKGSQRHKKRHKLAAAQQGLPSLSLIVRRRW